MISSQNITAMMMKSLSTEKSWDKKADLLNTIGSSEPTPLPD